MIYTLENNNIKITTSTFGGELHSLITKDDKTEFLWNGDEKYWKYHAPILFPIVGRVKNSQYRVLGTTYELPQHGLARTREFTMVNKTDDSITFELNWSEDTLKVYPYKFSLKITYTLVENGVTTTYTVNNMDDKTIYFSIGAHPAFMCPLKSNETMDDYYFEFNKKEIAPLMDLDASTGYFNHNPKEYFNNTNIIPLTKGVFDNDALVFENLKSNIISLKSKKHNTVLSMDFTGFPYIAVWSKLTGAPFVCIEPWYGHSDFSDFEGELKDKAGIQTLNLGETFTSNYTVFIEK
ncbi:aldose 1-epimerase family protein [Clostridium carnis]